MRLFFNVNYVTTIGEELLIHLTVQTDNDETRDRVYRMSSHNGKDWWYECDDTSFTWGTHLTYYYSVDNGGEMPPTEWKTLPHRLDLTAIKGDSYAIYNQWAVIPEDTYLYSAAFTSCFEPRHLTPLPALPFEKTVRLIVRAPQLRSNERLCLTGESKVLGAWDAFKALPMYEHQRNEWVVDLNADMLDTDQLAFKFIAVQQNNPRELLWETGSNRTLHLPKMKKGEVLVYDLSQAFFAIDDRRVAGTLVPLFSLRTKQSFGVGDFGDLKLLIEWASTTHQRVIQLLPINDTTTTHSWHDSYPYSCISVFALHPQYVNLNALPPLNDIQQRKHFAQLQKTLNALPEIDYERVNEAKITYLKAIYQQEGEATLKSDDFKTFFQASQEWLVPYAYYSYLRDKLGTANFMQWKGHSQWNEVDRLPLSTPGTKEYQHVAFFYYVQYILHRQMEAAHITARKHGIVLKGDIPIGVNRLGCDVWTTPHFFNLDGQAGAPPDDFAIEGQNWGFPTYNWKQLQQDGYTWWIKRLKHMSCYFDAYRIDHVLGFFRIWEIPVSATQGLLGQFSPALGLTQQEIESYGITFSEQQFTRPFINNQMIERVFHAQASYVKEHYLVHLHDDIYTLKPQFDTQQKVATAFANKHTSQDHMLRNGLYTLLNNVLFLNDKQDNKLFHPRIIAHKTLTYEALSEHHKNCFNRLYNDYFYQRNNQFWYREAMKKLPKLIEATHMLVCAEDLGMVPTCVSWAMQQLRILSLEVQSMPKAANTQFTNLHNVPYRSVCTPSTHDMPTLRQWWDEDTTRAQCYYNAMLYRGGAAPHPLPGWLARDILSHQLDSSSMLCVLSIQDWMAIDEKLRLPDSATERINIPSNPQHYWRYRMHVNLEDLLHNDDFKENISELILQSGRY